MKQKICIICKQNYPCKDSKYDSSKYCNKHCRSLSWLIDTINNFIDKIDKKNNQECWEWLGSKDEWGYGFVKIRNKNLRAHRVAFEIYYGQFDYRLSVKHTCHNFLCCNPSHLLLDSHFHSTELGKMRKERIV